MICSDKVIGRSINVEQYLNIKIYLKIEPNMLTYQHQLKGTRPKSTPIKSQKKRNIDAERSIAFFWKRNL